MTIIITKNGSNSGLVVDAASVDSVININHVQFSDNVDLAIDPKAGFDATTYAGPDFLTLDERLQQAFHEFLDGFGINEELGSFVEVLAVDKDQRLYSKWLKSVNSFLD